MFGCLSYPPISYLKDPHQTLERDKMHFLKKVLLALCASAVVATPVPDGQDTAPNPKDVSIQQVTWNGSGCQLNENGSPRDATYVMSSDRTTLTIIFAQYLAQAGPGTMPSDDRKNCQINLKVSIPQSWQYSVSSTTFRGFAQFDPTCSGYVKASYYFSGETQTVAAQYNFNGKKNSVGNYEATTTVVAVWPRCNIPTMFNINTEAYVGCQNRNQQAQLTVDSLDQKYQVKYHFLWRRC